MKKRDDSATSLMLDLSKLPPHMRPPSRPVSSRLSGAKIPSTTQRAPTEWSDYIARFEGKEL